MAILIVGGGKMGLSHLVIARQIAGDEPVVLCDASFKIRFLARRMGITAFHSLARACSVLGATLRGAIVATPTPSHHPVAKQLLEQRIPCFIEKPLTLSVERSKELLEIAEEAGTYAQVGFVLRYVSTFARLHDLAATGKLGRPLTYRAEMRGNVITKADRHWRSDYSAGGGCLNEYGPHLIDLCRFLFGDVRSLESAEMGQVHSTRADDRISVRWIHSDGTPGQLDLDWCDPSKRKSVIRFEVDFEWARVTADNSALQIAFSENCPLDEAERNQLSATGLPPRVSFYLRGEEFSLQLEDFIGQCLGRSLRVDLDFQRGCQATLADGLAVDQLISEISQRVGLR